MLYATGEITGNINVGGLVGLSDGGTVTDSMSLEAEAYSKTYSVIGNTSGTQNDRVTDAPASDMNDKGLYTEDGFGSYADLSDNWDFPGTWSITNGETYPWLSWQGEPGDHNMNDEVDNTAPTVDSVSTTDTDNDGKIEYTLAFSEPIDDNTMDVTDFDVVDGTSGDDLTDTGTTDDNVYTIESDHVDTADMNISYTKGTLADLAGNLMASVNDVGNEAGEDNVAPLINSAVTSQTAADVSFTTGETDDEITVTLADENGTNFLGAYGNEFDVVIKDSTDNDSNTTASLSETTLTVELKDNGTNPTALVSEVVTAINDVDGFTAAVTSNSDSNDDTAIAVASQVLTDGKDSISSLVLMTITESNSQILGKFIGPKSKEIEDLDGNFALTDIVTIELLPKK